MIIKKLEIISFGKFSNKTLDFSEGLNVIYGDNESGKSTVIDFIYAMFYGFGDNRGKSLSLREKYTPWSGGVCEGKISVLTDYGESICIYRKAGAVKKYDMLRVYNNDTGETLSVTPEDIIGVNGETFLKTLCIKQLSTVFCGNNDEITQKLSNIVSAGDENADYEKAQKILENIRREIRPQKGKGGELSEVLHKISEYEKNKDAQQSILTKLKSVEEHIFSTEKEVERIQKEYEGFSENDPASSIEEVMKEIRNKDESKAIKENNSSSPAFFMLAGIILLIISFFLIAIKKELYLISLPLSAACFFLEFSKRKPESKTTGRDLYNELAVLHSKKAEYDKTYSMMKDELFSSKTKLSQLKATEKALRDSIPEDCSISEDIYQKKLYLETKLKAVTLASEALKNAHINMQKNFTPTLNKKASEYLSFISGGKYTRLFCNEQFDILVDGDIPRKSEFFSGGTVDQLYLCVRLSLADMLFKESGYTMILDQPFLQYDDSRKEKAIKLLDNMDKNRQILLFTCDKNVNSTNKQTQILT